MSDIDLSRPEDTTFGFTIPARHVRGRMVRLGPVLEGVLSERFAHLSFHREIKPVLSRPAEPDMIAQFLEYDGVINGLAK